MYYVESARNNFRNVYTMSCISMCTGHIIYVNRHDIPWGEEYMTHNMCELYIILLGGCDNINTFCHVFTNGQNIFTIKLRYNLSWV